MRDIKAELVVEHEKLSAKINKLQTFLQGQLENQTISTTQIGLMGIQLLNMTAYQGSLTMRIEDLGNQEVKAENSFEGFTAVNDNGTVKHIAQIGSFHRDLITAMQSSGFVAGEALQAYIKLEGYGKFTANDPCVFPTDYLVIMDSNPDDKYVCPSEVMKAKKLV